MAVYYSRLESEDSENTTAFQEEIRVHIMSFDQKARFDVVMGAGFHRNGGR